MLPATGWGKAPGLPQFTYKANINAEIIKPIDKIVNDSFIPGLKYIPNFVSSEESAELVRQIDACHWSTEIRRRVQQYGYHFIYQTGKLNPNKLGELPVFCDSMISRLRDNYFPYTPDQMIINEYQPGQGINPHVDNRDYFDEYVASISLLSPCVMEFRNIHTMENKPLLLEPNSLVVLTGVARYEWTHGIRQIDRDVYHGVVIPRERRISLTFRKVKMM